MSLLSRLAISAARAYGILSSKSTNVSADYLVVAGGGGGGASDSGQDVGGGGGGAGGLLTSTFTLSTLNTYSITVGAGGNGGPAGSNVGSQGASSSVSGTGLTTVTSTGGGFGGTYQISQNGGTGGSGGGGAGGSSVIGTGGSATASPTQGFAGGNSGAVGVTGYAAGGGGGASAAGQNGSTVSRNGGNGGNGSASSISGTSVTYAGGGGGGCYTGFTAGTGGSGGGGNAGTWRAAGNSGTANLGGGGGGASGGTLAGGNGGSGIVIISYTSATPKFVGGTITTSGGKQIHTFTSSGTLSPITPITASYLVVAGGGSGGSENANGAAGGGGGAGGLLTGSTTLYSGATYVVTVGAGAASGASGRNNGLQGSNSVLSGTGLTTLTSTGGGYGACYPNSGGNGGSGGGGGSEATTSGGTGTSGQGNNGGGSNGGGAGGGGGAGAVGGNGTSSTSGAGGIGVSSSISGTATYYAGGGGGGYDDAGGTQPAGAGGNGGGGAGGGDNANGVSGTPNTGGGGGGKGQGASAGVGGQGGSGIVIISYAGSQVFNGGLVTTSGGNTIHTFTSTGALTPLTNNLNNSLRFRSSASAYLNRTPTVAGNRKTWTYSAWIKRGALPGSELDFFSASPSVDGAIIRFNSDNTLRGYDYSGSFSFNFVTTQVFRDPSAWYHIVVAYDSTQATSGNRFKVYVNGNQVTAFSSTTYPSLNQDTYWFNNANVHNIGRNSFSGASYFDGYMTDINFIDGQALEPYYFGNNDANGVWKPIQYKGTYGTNGFYLTFGNTTSTTTLGYDSSPNGNNWTCNNISLTAGTTYDAMTDVPTNTSATVANYAVLNPLDTGSNITLSAANLQTSQGAAAGISKGTIGISSGKWYWEVTLLSGTTAVGIADVSSSRTQNYVGQASTSYGYYSGNGNKYNNATGTSYGASYTTNDVIGVALDMDAGTLTFYKNNTSQGTAYSSLSGTFTPAIGNDQSNTTAFNAGQRPFSYTPPTGYVALNTFNIPTPTILQGNKYMDATLWTGNGYPTGGTQVVVNAGQFKPDLIWVKERGGTGYNIFTDSVRGLTKNIYTNATLAENTNNGTDITSINSNGFSLGADTGGDGFNRNGVTTVGWQWQAGQGSTSSNTSGSITSTVSVNTTAGFSVVTYSGNSVSGATVGHGLGVSPAMIILKCRSNATNYRVYHSSFGSTTTSTLYLNLTNATSNTDNERVSAVSNSTFTVTYSAAGGDTNTSGRTYVAYCWAEIAGFSKFGSYTGNGSSDGPFVFTNFRPKYVMIKGNAVVNWWILDTSRNTYNVANEGLLANSSGATNATINPVDFVSNGFKLRDSNGEINANGTTYVYACFAEHPFKNSNAR